jgi:hypothetical protein
VTGGSIVYVVGTIAVGTELAGIKFWPTTISEVLLALRFEPFDAGFWFP